MAKLDDLLEDLVTANHVLAKLGIVDSFGHISIRHPDPPPFRGRESGAARSSSP